MRGRRPTLKAVDGGLLRTPPMPPTLAADCAADWQTTTADLLGRGLLQPAVIPLVETYVAALWMNRVARQAVADKGALILGTNGAMKPNPAIALWKSTTADIARLASELGLSALGRSRAGIREQERAADAASGLAAKWNW